MWGFALAGFDFRCVGGLDLLAGWLLCGLGPTAFVLGVLWLLGLRCCFGFELLFGFWLFGSNSGCFAYGVGVCWVVMVLLFCNSYLSIF